MRLKRAGQRLLVLVLAGALLVILLAQRAEGRAIEGYTASFNRTWAKAAFSAFRSSFWDAKQNYLLDQYPDPSGRQTAYWTAAQGFDTLIDAALLYPDDHTIKDLIYDFFHTQEKIGWRRDYYDDENWMAMALVRAFEVTKDQRFLNQAIKLWEDITGAWDTSCCGPVKGGLWWDRMHTQKATASNAGPVILSLMLHKIAPANQNYLQFAHKVYQFWLQNMVNPSTHQVADHMTPDGTKVWWKFPYNEGLMIGASVEMYRATKNSTYLAIAQRIASFMYSNEVTKAEEYLVLFDGSNDACKGDCEQFKGIGFRYLTHLFNVLNATGMPSAEGLSATDLLAFLLSNVEALWTYARNPTLNLIAVNWAGPAPVPTAVNPVYQAQQNSGTMALLIFGLLSQ